MALVGVLHPAARELALALEDDPAVDYRVRDDIAEA